MNSEVALQLASVDKLRQVLTYVFYVSLALVPAALIFDVIQYDLIVSMRDQTFDPAIDISAKADASDTHQAIMGWGQTAIGIISLVLWFVWIFKSNRLARALGVTKMQYTPGWSVGWYFVPILNIFKPFLAMRELYLASLSPTNFDTSREPDEMPASLHFVTLWRLLWLADGWVSKFLFKHSRKAEAVDELVFVTKLTIFAELLSAISAIFCVVLIKQIWQVQSGSFAKIMTDALPQTA